MDIVCSGCGKKIPYAGQVCPYCQRDKSADQNNFNYAMAAGFVAGIIGWFVSGIALAIGGFLIAIVAVALYHRFTYTSAPPDVSIADPGARPPSLRVTSSIAATTDSTDGEGRLLKLKSLYDKGLISETEYHQRRKDILDTL